MGGEALGSAKVRCPSVGECQGGEGGRSALVGGGAPSWRQWGGMLWVFPEGKLGKGIMFEM